MNILLQNIFALDRKNPANYICNHIFPLYLSHLFHILVSNECSNQSVLQKEYVCTWLSLQYYTDWKHFPSFVGQDTLEKIYKFGMEIFKLYEY